LTLIGTSPSTKPTHQPGPPAGRDRPSERGILLCHRATGLALPSGFRKSSSDYLIASTLQLRLPAYDCKRCEIGHFSRSGGTVDGLLEGTPECCTMKVTAMFSHGDSPDGQCALEAAMVLEEVCMTGVGRKHSSRCSES
jgi:hypothetical protein